VQSERLPLLLNYLLVDFEDLLRLLAEAQGLELESGLHEHEHGDFGFERESVPRQVVPVNCLFKLADLL